MSVKLVKLSTIDELYRYLMDRYTSEYKVVSPMNRKEFVISVESLMYAIGRELDTNVTCQVRRTSDTCISGQYSMYRNGSVILAVSYGGESAHISINVNRNIGGSKLLFIENYIAYLLKDLYSDDPDLCVKAYKQLRFIKDKFDFSVKNINVEIGLDVLKFGKSQYSELLLDFSSRIEPVESGDEVIDFINSVVWNFYSDVVWSSKYQAYKEV